MRSRSGLVARAALIAAAAALSACVAVPSGIRVPKPEQTDKVSVQAPPPGWRRIAVVPFGGDPAHRRPAEELVALALQRHVPFAVLGPFSLRRWQHDAAVPGPLAEPGPWAPTLVDGGGAGVPLEQLRALAEAVGADALVLGFVAPGGGSADLALVDASSGAPVATLRRAGDPRAAELGVHELAMSSTRAALADLVEVLRTPPGQRPRVDSPPVASTTTPSASSPWEPP